MNEFIMNKEMMTLTQFLKAGDVMQSGGQANYFLQEYTVLVKGRQTNMRGKKLYPGDIVVVNNSEFILRYDQET